MIARRNGMIGAAAAALLVAASVLSTNVEAQDTKSTWDGVFTAEQAERGSESYQRECAQCHLEDLLGDGIAPSLVGAPFHFRWSELSVGDMLVAIRTTMPQGAPASLSPRAYVDIVAYLLERNDFPAGDMELPTDQDVLESIIIQEEAQ
jgi:mono/diheme cytochrome c family protein